MRLSISMPKTKTIKPASIVHQPNLGPAVCVRMFFESRIGPTGLLSCWRRASSRVPSRSW